MKPDISCYAEESLKHIPKVKGVRGKYSANLGRAELFMEVKRIRQQDFFCDPAPGADVSQHSFILDHIRGQKAIEHATEAFGQNVAYATEACSRQHRLFYFSVCLSGCFARLIRWDRAGAIATRAFDIRRTPQPLCEFLWRFSHATNEMRGYDPTVEWATKSEETRFAAALRVKLAHELEDDERVETALSEHYQPGAVAAIRVFGSDNAVERVLVSRPVKAPLSMASRATRGYWAVTADDDVVFLKDTWRYYVDGLEQEGKILARLLKLGVRNIPEMGLHGDVPQGDKSLLRVDPSFESCPPDGECLCCFHGAPFSSRVANLMDLDVQRTRTDRYQCRPWSCTGGRRMVVIPHVHYRLILRTVGFGLEHFDGTHELLHATFNAYEGELCRGSSYM